MCKRLTPILTCVALALWLHAPPAIAQPNCVDECLDEPGENVLELIPPRLCVQPGDVFDLELWQRNLQELVRGFQATIAFDPACLQVESIVCTDEPYGVHILCRFDNIAGTIDVATGIDDPGQPPTQDDALLATITFHAVAECCDLDPEIFGTIVCFRPHEPPTRFTNVEGYEVTPCLKFARVKIDGTPPTCTCPDDMTVQCVGDVPDPDPSQLMCVDNCDPDPVKEWVGDQDNGGTGCPNDPLIITRTYRCTDCSGNFCECSQIITVIDETPPECTCPDDLSVQCVADVPDPDPSQVVCVDNCDPNPSKEWVGDEDNGGAGCPGDPLIITRTYRCTDFCGNYCECTQTITVGDDTPPECTCPDDLRVQCVEDVPPPDPSQVVCVDNCDPDPSKEWVGDEDNGGAGCPGDPLIITRRYRCTDFCGNYCECTQTITVIDDTPPDCTCPDDITVQCLADVPDPDPSQVVCVDNCDPDPSKEWVGDEDNGGAGCPGDPLIITRTYRCTDFCGNYCECTQTITVGDDTPPECTCPDDITVQCIEDVPAPDPGSVACVDNCDRPENPPVVTWEGDTDNGGAGCPGDPLIITRTYRCTDFCDNYCECTQVITVIDDTPPEFLDGCQPPVVTVYPNAGECEAYVCLPVPAATDNCDDEVTIEGMRGDGLDLYADPYPAGMTVVWWIATDNCGNDNVCVQIVDVRAENLVIVHVELQGVLFGPLSRCIDFELWNCATPDEPAAIHDQVITFVSNGSDRSTGTAELHVPCGLYECMTAQDLLHTLRSTDELSIIEYTDQYTCPDMVRTKYRAEYRGPRNPNDPDEIGHWLLGGNFDQCINPDEEYVDILDFGVYSWQWGVCYDSDGDGEVDGNTTCPACDMFPHADANGDGCVDTIDFSFIFINFWKRHEPPCCAEQPGGPEPGPITEISVAELRERGWTELAAGDLNGDGWLDMDDVHAFLDGARPRPHVEPALPPDNRGAMPSGSPDSRLRQRP